MVYKTYISKFATIVSNSKINTGLNPVSELVYGHDTVVSRALFYFDHSKVKKLIDDGIMIDKAKMKHTLHITNAGSIDMTQLHTCETSSINDNKKIRAASFDIIFFLIPKPWDRGKGFNYTKTHFNVGYYSPAPIDPKRLVSEDGCNWFQRQNGLKWDEEGVYTNDRLSQEYDKWAAGDETSIVIGRQHFDYGNECINFDITEVFNKFLDGDLENYGIGMAFSPMLEVSDSEYENYVGWLTDKTNTFFEPFVETRYDDVVSDDRSNFVLNKRNRLYLYCTIGDSLEDLDKLPTVTITNGEDEVIRGNGGMLMEEMEAKKFAKGIYYIDVLLSKGDFEADTMLYDTWNGLVYKGVELDAVELDFTLKDTPNFFNIGNSMEADNITYNPMVSGIKEKEQIKRGDIRKLIINGRPSYTYNTYELLDSMDIRVYVKDGTREIDVIEWDRINKAFTNNYYVIDTNILIPNRYYVDIRIKYGMNSIVHHDVLSFDIVDDLNNRYA
jgi:hypothetical protein